VIYLDAGRTTPVPVIAEGDTWGMQGSASGGVGYDFYFDAFSIGPYVRANYTRSYVDGFAEDNTNGSGLHMKFGEDNTDSFTSVVGLGASYAISTDFGVIIPQGRVEWEHEFARDARTIEAQFVNDATGTTFLTRTDSPDRNYFNAAASVLLLLPNGWMAFADYEALLAYHELERHRGTIGVRVEF